MYALLSRFIPSLFSFSLCPTFPQSLHKSPHGTFSYKYPRHSPLCLPFDLDTADGKRDIGQHRHPDQRSHCDTVNTHFLTTSHTNLSHPTLLFDAKTNVQARLYFFSQTHITQVHSVSLSITLTPSQTHTFYLPHKQCDQIIWRNFATSAKSWAIIQEFIYYFCKIFNLIWQILYTFGQSSISVNGQMF